MAIKVVRSTRKYRDAAMIEVGMLQRLGKNDEGSSRYSLYCTLECCWEKNCLLFIGNVLTILLIDPFFAAVFACRTGLIIEITFAL